MDNRRAERLLEEPLPRSRVPAPDQLMFTKNDPAATLKAPAPRERRQMDKRSLDYILRSAVAGGLAGCAVSWSNPFPRLPPEMLN